MENVVAAVLQQAGFEVEKAVIVEREFVRTRTQGTAFHFVTAEDQFLVPPARLRWSIDVHIAYACWVCKGCDVVCCCVAETTSIEVRYGSLTL